MKILDGMRLCVAYKGYQKEVIEDRVDRSEGDRRKVEIAPTSAVSQFLGQEDV